MDKKRKRPKLGDIIEIKTKKGLSYCQYTHNISNWGALIRVFKTKYNNQPVDFKLVINDEIQFSTFFPLGAACNRNIVTIVSNQPIPGELLKFPLFKAPGFIDKTGNIINWFLWDGKHDMPIKSLTNEYKNLPYREIINDTLLIERIENNWNQSNIRG